MTAGFVVALVLLAVVVLVLSRAAVVVPQQTVFVVERLGRFSDSLTAGFHILTPFVDVVRYRMSLKETAVDIPEQICITRDNVQVGVDGVIYLKVVDPKRAAYGVSDFMFAISQLAQTALRSEFGKIDLDRSFEERTTINGAIIVELDKASEPWGVKVLRYEIKNISPPRDVLMAMEKQMRAEREKRAQILASEGSRDAAINTAEGHKQQRIKESEGARQQRINEAEGQSQAIVAIARATATGLTSVAAVADAPGGEAALRLRVAEQYVQQLGRLAKESTSLVLPMSLSDVGGVLQLATQIMRRPAAGGAPAATAGPPPGG